MKVKLNENVQNLVQNRILEIEYVLDINEIGRDLIPAEKQVELRGELVSLQMWLKEACEAQGLFNGNYDKWVSDVGLNQDADEYDAMMAIACR